MSKLMRVKTGIEGLDEIAPGFPSGGMVIVSGSPGTGKTSLAASFIYNGAVKYGEPGVYASLIEDEDRFHEYMHGFGYNFRELEEKGLFRYIALPTLLQEGVSASINMVLEIVESIKARRLVIDSYTALSQMFRSQAEARTFLHTLISRIVKQLECTTILIKEEQAAEKKEYGFEDFIADAVIHLKTSRLEDKLIRELTIVKLRGSEVRLPDACFTLHGGFRVLTTLGKLKTSRGSCSFPEDPPDAYSTGIPSLDKEIGGYPRGAAILFELDPKLQVWESMMVLAPFGGSFIEKGRHHLAITSGGVLEEDVRSFFHEAYGFPESVLKERLHVFAGSTRNDDPFGKFLERVRNIKSPTAILIGVDRLARIYGEDEAVRMLEIGIDHIRRCGSTMIWLFKPTRPTLRKRLPALAHLHFKLRRKHGCVLLYGVKPRTPLYAVQPDPTGETLTPEIIPIT